MVKLIPKDFIVQLENLFRSSPGSVFITYKHFNGQYSVKKSGKGPMKTIQNLPEHTGSLLLVRATDGNNGKISTIVSARDIVSFQISLDRTMKRSMTGFQKTEGASSKK